MAVNQAVPVGQTPAGNPGPVSESERIPLLDILRGFAVMGILVVNLPVFARPELTLNEHEPRHWYDVLAKDAETLLFVGKFYPIFAFLFGLGFYVQLARAEARGQDLRSWYRRRLWILLAIGFLHAALFWSGEILRLYAVLGFVLLAFRRRSTRTVLIWAGLSVAGAFVAYLGLLGIMVAAGWVDGPIVFAGIDLLEFSRTAYDSPWPWPVIAFQTVLLPLGTLSLYLSQGGISLVLFLVGLAVGRSGILERLRERRRAVRRVFLITLPAGLLLGLPLLLDNELVALLVGMPATPVLATAYVSGLALLSLTSAGLRGLRPLSAVGRMALSNYVLQSVICSVLFNGYGFGLHDRVGEAALFGLAIAIFVVQIPLSGWWLARYRFGPLEWGWRSLTYRQRQPMRRQLARR